MGIVSSEQGVSKEPERVTVASLAVRILGDLENMNIGQEDAITEAFSHAVNVIERRLADDFPELRIDVEET